jgi:leucine dehydrogenase
MAMKAAAKVRWGKDTLTGRRVAVQGAGKVAQHLARHLHEVGAKLIDTDIDDAKVQRFVADFGAAAVAPDAIYDAAVDVYAPCALGNSAPVQRLPTCGGAGRRT